MSREKAAAGIEAPSQGKAYESGDAAVPLSLPKEGAILRNPTREDLDNSNITAFLSWLHSERGIDLADYDALWRWSVEEREDFWAALWDFFGIEASQPYRAICEGTSMEEERWFPGARLNFAHHMLRIEAERPDDILLNCYSETSPPVAWSWSDVGRSVRSLATALRDLGVQPGDRIAAYMPNIPQTTIAMLAATAVGAVWTCCSPEYGVPAIIDRFGDIAPKILIATDGYVFGGRTHDRREIVREISDRLPSVDHVVMVPNIASSAGTEEVIGKRYCDWDELISTPAPPREDFVYEQVESDHPLWIVYTSGTTSKPKAIVHTHGGTLMGLLKDLYFHTELKPSSVIFFYSTTSWVIWNNTLGAMLLGARIAIYDGSPRYPDLDRLWRIAEDVKATIFGTSPAAVGIMMQHGYVPKDMHDIAALDLLVLAGAPASPEIFAWLLDALPPSAHVISQCGSTELCGAYAAGVRTLPVRAGEISARALGMDVESLDPSGQPIRDAVGELVIRQSFPNIPRGIWGDTTGERFHQAYFASIPGMWRQGDLIRINNHGGCVVVGRSDSTINRHGVRMGTSEIYRTLEAVDDVIDGIALHPKSGIHADLFVLFVTVKEGVSSDDALTEKIKASLRQGLSPRHVPDLIISTPLIPYTVSGKRMEVPLRRLLEGEAVETLFDPAAMANADAAQWFAYYARTPVS